MRKEAFTPRMASAALLFAALLSPATAPAQVPEVAAGRLLVEYVPVKTEDYVPYEQVLREQRVLEAVAEELNNSLRMTHDMTVRVQECGDSSATWEPVPHRIRLCYELLQAVLELSVAAAGPDDEERADRWFSGTVTFMVFHMLGHALIDQYGLQTGLDEEVAADQFAMVALGGAVGQPQEVLGALEFLGHAIGSTEAEGLGFLDAHRYTRARFDALACGFAGALPAAIPWLLQMKLLAPAGAPRCGEEFAVIERRWDAWLAPWLRAAPPPAPVVR